MGRVPCFRLAPRLRPVPALLPVVKKKQNNLEGESTKGVCVCVCVDRQLGDRQLGQSVTVP